MVRLPAATMLLTCATQRLLESGDHGPVRPAPALQRSAKLTPSQLYVPCQFNRVCLQINTWSRTAYVQPLDPPAPAEGKASLESGAAAADPSTRLIQEWTNIDNNFVMVRLPV